MNECESWMKKSGRKDRMLRENEELTAQRKEFDAKSNRSFWWINTTALRLSGNVPKGYILSFMVMLKIPVPRQIIDRKLEEMFGDLK